jgi:hypothetical protein
VRTRRRSQVELRRQLSAIAQRDRPAFIGASGGFSTMTLPNGATDKYMRFHDAYIKHSDGTLDVVRGGRQTVVRLRVGAVDRVEGDETTWKTVYSGVPLACVFSDDTIVSEDY